MYVARYHNKTIEFTQEQILSSISCKLYRIPNTSLKIRAGASSLNHRTQLNVLIMHTHFIFQVSISICKRKATIYKLIQNIFPMYYPENIACGFIPELLIGGCLLLSTGHSWAPHILKYVFY